MRRLAPLAAALLAGMGAALLFFHTLFEGEGPAGVVLLASALCLLGALAAAARWLLPAVRHHDRRPAPRSQRLAFTAALLTLLAVGGTLGQLDGLLQGFHRPGEGQAGLGALTGITSPRNRELAMEAAVETWSRYARPGPHGLLAEDSSVRPFENDRDAPVTVLAWHVGLETGLFVPAVVALLGLLIVWAAHTIDRREANLASTGGAERTHGFRRAAIFAATSLLAAAAFDAAENLLVVGQATSAWFGMEGANGIAPADTSGAVALLLVLSSAGKVLGFLGALSFVVVSGVFLIRHGGSREAEWAGLRGGWQALLAARIQLLVALAFGGALLFHEQVADTIRRWADRPAVGAWGVALTLLLAAGIWHSARWSSAYWGTRQLGGSRLLARSLALPAALAAICFGFLSGAGSWSTGALVPVGMVVAIAVLSYPAREPRPAQLPLSFGETAVPRPDGDRPGLGRWTWPSLLAAVVVAVLGLVLVKASAAHGIYATMRGTTLGRTWPLVVGGVALLALAGAGFWRLRALDQRREPSSAIIGRRFVPAALLSASVVAWALIVRLLAANLEAGAVLGVVGVLSVFLLLATYTGSILVAAADRLVDRPPAAFRLVGLSRTPVVSLLVVWVTVAALLPLESDVHVAVPAGESGTLRSGEDLESAFRSWLGENCLTGARREPGPTTLPAVPMVFVASSGGGVRAAVWTSHVLDRTLGQPLAAGCESADGLADGPESRSHWVFAMSGVSGGSLGIATYAAQLGTRLFGGTLGEAWVRERLDGDYLADTFAWMLFVETTESFLRFGGDRDRADVMERSFERTQRELAGGFFDLASRDRMPILLFNGTSVESGCRFVVSALETNGRDPSEPSSRCLSPLTTPGNGVLSATVELVDFVCADQEIALSTAVMLSARFPVISPSGEVRQCVDGPDEEPDHNTFVVDGGYLENSGAATVLELWSALTPLVAAHNADPAATACVVPVFIQIDNGYEEPAGPGAAGGPPQFVVPVSTVRSSRFGRTAAARQAAQLAFDRAFTLGGVQVSTTGVTHGSLEHRYAHFATLAHPGEKAPLGWILSRDSFDDLIGEFERSQLGDKDDEARPGSALERVNTWFDGLSCELPA